MSRQLNAFAIALDYCLAAHHDTPSSLLASLGREYNRDVSRVLSDWRRAKAHPVHQTSHETLSKVEQHYQLPNHMFANLLGEERGPLARLIHNTIPSQQTALKWHIPNNFDDLSPKQRTRIMNWAKTNILPCATDYGRYQSRVSQIRFSVVFPSLLKKHGGRTPKGFMHLSPWATGKRGSYGTIEATPELAREIEDLVAFRTNALPPRGLLRAGRWRFSTAGYQVRRYGELFGALAAAPLSNAAGLGVPLSRLTCALLVFPSVWDWYLRWREQRRGGFFTEMERSLLYEAKAATRDPTGWLRQNPRMAKRLLPIPGLVSGRDIASAVRNWERYCDRMFNYASSRALEVHRQCRTHRDPFTPILACLEAEKPLVEYKRIGDEILRLLPEMETRLKRASALRNYVMFRIALHLGIRQRNLRELLLCPKGQRPRSLQRLDQLERGELRWNRDLRKWVAIVPASAFKNRTSTFFQGRPWELALPNLEGLYDKLEEYFQVARPCLIHGEDDPHTVLVRFAGRAEGRAEFDLQGFYAAWKRMIQIFGIYNPFTKRGAIKGLLPHGPHCARDILATHILKETCSYELAAFAIQDNTESVMRHYGRFLPKEKAAQAAEVLNKVWMQ